jgi:uncharacterized protein YegJ (DUF2314 family)
MRLLPFALVVAGLACRRAPPVPAAPAEPAPPPMIVSDQDREMNTAMAEGRKTLPRFLEALRQPPAGSEGFAIKATFRNGDQVEHMWLQEPRIVGDKLDGVLANDPAYLEGYKSGQRLSVGREQIVDWSYIKDGVLVGGYTLRVMFSRVPAAERAALQKELGYRFE